MDDNLTDSFRTDSFSSEEEKLNVPLRSKFSRIKKNQTIGSLRSRANS